MQNPKGYNPIDTKFFGVLVIFLGCFVILGWITHIPILIQLLPTFVPMQFNTALGFVLSGLAMCLFNRFPKFSGIISSVLIILGFLTLLEYICLLNFHIDELFIRHYISTYTSHPGRMSPNTALCFTLTGIAYLAAVFQAYKWSQICSLILTIIVGSLGVLSILGYFFGLKFIFGWGNLTGMAFHTAVGFSLIGVGSYRTFSHKLTQKKFTQSYLFPIFVFAIGIIIFLLSWQGLVSSEDEKIQRDMHNDAEFISEKIKVVTLARVEAIERIFKRTSLLGKENRNLLESDKNDYFSDFKNLLLIDYNYLMHQEELYLQKGVSLKEGQDVELECNKSLNNNSIYKPYKVQLVVTNNYFCIYETNYHYLAVFSNAFIQDIISSERFYKYHLFLKAGSQSYGNIIDAKSINNFYVNQWSSETTFNFENEQWVLKIWLDGEQIRELSSDYPVLYLLMGLIFSILLTIAIRLWQISERNNTLINEANQKSRAVIENSPSGIFIVKDDGGIIFSNNQSCKITGYSINIIMQSKLPELITSSEGFDFQTCFQYSKNIKLGELTGMSIMNVKGEKIPIEVSLTPIVLSEMNCFLVTVVDISERKKVEEKAARYLTALKRSNEELDSFAYIASHDLKEPLRGIHNYSSFLLEDYGNQLDEDGQQQLKTLQKLSKRMEDLINNLLSFSKVGRTELAITDCDLNKILNEKIEFLADFIKCNCAEIIIAKDLPHVYCDKVRIGEVFQNLITNGIKYNNQEHKIITIDFENKLNEIVFTVSDNGIGIKKEHYDDIFKIFRRLHRREEFGGGSGAGMTIVKKIIERHGGRIWLHSSENKGTTFYFSIPKKMEINDDK